MRRIALVFAVCGVLTGGLAIGVPAGYSHQLVDKRASGGLSEAQFQQFLEDQRALTANGPLPTRRGTRDAGEILNRWVAVDDADADEAAWWAQPAVGTALRCEGAPESEGPRYLACLDSLPTGDVSFLDALHRYDVWDPGSSGAWGRQVEAHLLDPGATLSLPRYVPWKWLAELRLADGFRRGDLLPALADVRQLAVLTWTHESLIGEVLALAVLGIEREAYEAGVARGLLPAEAWSPVPEAEVQRYKRVVFATASVYQGLGPPDAGRRLLAAVPHPIGECAAVQEATLVAPMVRALYTHTWPGEVNLAGSLVALEATLAGDQCRLRQARALWAAPERDLALLQDPEEPWVAQVLHFPWGRQVVGGILLTTASSDFNLYDEASTDKAP